MSASEKPQKTNILSVVKSLVNLVIIPTSILTFNLFSLFKIFENGKLRASYYYSNQNPSLNEKVNNFWDFLFVNQNYLYILAILVFQIFLLYLAGKFQAAEKKNWIDFHQILLGIILVPFFLILLFILLISLNFSHSTKNV